MTASPLDALIPPPELVRSRAWMCAFELGGEHSNTIGDEARWLWLQSVVLEGQSAITWRRAGQLFRLARLVRARLAEERAGREQEL